MQTQVETVTGSNESLIAFSFPPVDRVSRVDRALWLRLRNGDGTAVRELFARHSADLLNLAYGMTGDQGRAERLVQDAFLELFRNRRRCRAGAPVVRTLYGLVARRCLAELGGNGHAPETGSGASAGLRRVIEDALHDLSPSERAALLLNRSARMGVTEIAYWIGERPRDARALLWNALRTVRDAIALNGGFARALPH